jgi:hypothetical protein
MGTFDCFVVDKETIGLVFLQILQFRPINIVPPTLHTYVYFIHPPQTYNLIDRFVKLKTCHSQNFEV